MDVSVAAMYLTRYGALAVFIIVFLEYLNLPGFPAGVVMPAAGIIASQGGLNFALVLLLSTLAGLCGSWVLYGVGRLGGQLFLKRYLQKHPRQAPRIERLMDKLRQKGFWAVFLFKLVPAVRTLISIPAGVLAMHPIGYTVFSALGILIWNTVFIGAGYLFGERALQFFAS